MIGMKSFMKAETSSRVHCLREIEGVVSKPEALFVVKYYFCTWHVCVLYITVYFKSCYLNFKTLHKKPTE